MKTQTVKINTIGDYIAAFPEDIQKILQQVYTTIKKAAPESGEKISYGMPAFTMNEKHLVYFAAFKNHIGFYALPSGHAKFQKELSHYKSGKGSVQFPLDEPMPLSLITKIVKFRLKEMAEKEKSKPVKKAAKKTAVKKVAAKKVIAKKSIALKEPVRAKKYVKYHNDGSIWAKGQMKGDTMTGYWEWFRKDGVIMRSGSFENGKQVGEWTTYDKKGKVYKVTKMR